MPTHLTGFGVLVQAEMAERCLAEPSTKSYSALTVLLRLCGEGRITRQVGRQVFTPRPQVDSVFVVWRRTSPPSRELERVHRLCRRLFLHRRKMLRNLLRGEFPEEESWWTRLGIEPTARPEEVAPERFRTLATALEKERGSLPEIEEKEGI